MSLPWLQNYDPLGNTALSTAAAAVPVCTLFYFLAVRRAPAWRAAAYGCLAAAAVALGTFHMPPGMVVGAGAAGLVFGSIRIAWVLVAALFVYRISIESGHFEVIRQSVGAISADRRLQALFIGFALGTLLEGAGGGAAVAVTAAIAAGLGIPPLQAAVICLVGNSASVAYGGLGNPVRALVASTGLKEVDLVAGIVRILALATLALPFWTVRAFSKTRASLAIWPALLASGIAFAAVQSQTPKWIPASLVDIAGGIAALTVLALVGRRSAPAMPGLTFRRILLAWSPFLLLASFIVIWGTPSVSVALDSLSWRHPVPGLHLKVVRTQPMVTKPRPEAALFEVSWLSTPGTAGFLAALIAAPLAGLSFRKTFRIFSRLLWRLRPSVLAIALLATLAYITRYSGMDATIGVGLSKTGALFPFFAATIGWLGAVFSGTAAGSNAMFGGLQVTTARSLGLSPILLGSANAAGGAMGKMLSAQSLVVACAATGQEGGEGDVFGAVARQSLGLLGIVALLVLILAYVNA